MTKRTRGVSYIELLAALTIFAVLLMAALPLISQSGRNLEVAREGYAAHLAAQGIMLAVRDSVPVTSPAALNIIHAQAAAEQAAERVGAEMFGVWIFTEGTENAGGTAPSFAFGSDNMPEISPKISGLGGFSFAENTYIIVAAVFNEHFHMAGRAVGAVILN